MSAQKNCLAILIFYIPTFLLLFTFAFLTGNLSPLYLHLFFYHLDGFVIMLDGWVSRPIFLFQDVFCFAD